MTLTLEQVAPHLDRFLDMLDTAFRRYSSSDGLPDRFREAVRATPRHLFVHRFRIGGGPLQARIDEGALRNSDADPASELADIYSDAVMTHVDAAGNKLPSTNSQPSYVLWLLHMLDLQPGQRVLEIGSGSGWLAAVMTRLVGESGRVTGVEIIPELAAQSRADLAGLGLGNVSVLAIDAAEGHVVSAPFDRGDDHCRLLGSARRPVRPSRRGRARPGAGGTARRWLPGHGAAARGGRVRGRAGRARLVRAADRVGPKQATAALPASSPAVLGRDRRGSLVSCSAAAGDGS